METYINEEIDSLVQVNIYQTYLLSSCFGIVFSLINSNKNKDFLENNGIFIIDNIFTRRLN